VWLQNNQLSGTVPSRFGTNPSPHFLHIDQNKLEGPLPESMVAAGIQLIEFSFEQAGLSGPLPPSLFKMPRLESIQGAYNAFTGQLPPLQTNMTSIYSLDLSFNDLGGTLPTEGWYRLPRMSTLKLNNNRISGVPLM
jgi:hypothetical protein